MSDYNVLSVVSRTLSRLLYDTMSKDATLAGIIGNESAIVFSNPTETARQSSNRLSIWLYQVCENEHTKNRSAVRRTVGQTTALFVPPLTLNLHFLVTPFGETSDANLLLLGEIMHIFYENPIVVLRDDNFGVFEELHILLSRLSLQELTHVWYALMEPYRLSVCYEVRVMHVDSKRQLGGARVIDLTQQVGGVPALEEVGA